MMSWAPWRPGGKSLRLLRGRQNILTTIARLQLSEGHQPIGRQISSTPIAPTLATRFAAFDTPQYGKTNAPNTSELLDAERGNETEQQLRDTSRQAEIAFLGKRLAELEGSEDACSKKPKLG